MAIPLEELAPYLKDIKREIQKARESRIDNNFGYTDELGQYYTPLSSVNVYPEPWQYDFTNIGSKKFRNELLNIMPPVFIKKSEEFPYKQTEVLKNIYNVWNSAGRPKMYLADEAPEDLNPQNALKSGRSYFTPSQNVIVLTNIWHILDELAHPIQRKAGVNTGPLPVQQQIQYRKTPFLDNLSYNIPTFYEYETHEQIQPKLEDYVKTGKWPTYNGTFLVGDPSAIEKFGNSSLFNSVNNLYK